MSDWTTGAWTESKVEEVISALWLIAALVAWSAGIRWFACLLFVKSAADSLISIHLARKEYRQEQSNNQSSEQIN